MQDATVRCFLGLGLGADDAAAVQACLAPLQQEPWASDLRWVAPRNWHVTLAFLGQQSRPWLAALETQCQASLPSLALEQNLRLPVACVCGFPDARGKRVALELLPDPALLRLKTGLDQVLHQQGAVLENRAYRPHVTVARFERGQGMPVTPLPCDLVLGFSRLTLFQSSPGADGSEYQALWSLPLS